MKRFLDEDFLLHTDTARYLYHEVAKHLPIIDYHCHLPVQQIAEDHQFENLTQIWLYGDHYKWRAMRTHGVDESYCTGNQPDEAKFMKWAETVPYTLRNPLYHWTHLELQRYFGINDLLDPASARHIYERCSNLLRTPEYRVRNLLRKMKVVLVCTTDDPTDDLRFHKLLRQEFEIPVLPAFRADKAMQVSNPAAFNAYVNRLEAAANQPIASWQDFLYALHQRHDYFAQHGCNVSDHGLEYVEVDDEITSGRLQQIFNKIRTGHALDAAEQHLFRAALLLELAQWDHEKGWIQQFHLGALRNANSRLMKKLGPDTGWDSIGDYPQATALAKFLDQLDQQNRLAKTILYNLNPADNELFATMAGNFNDGTYPGKVQYGAAWWFLDQLDGMTRQLNALSNMGLISHFVGMVTDSRSFLSYPRHEYFRRLLCDLFGREMENGELPDDRQWIAKIIRDVCYFNARNYFNWQQLTPAYHAKEVVNP
jgi:glucuronate isomerase